MAQWPRAWADLVSQGHSHPVHRQTTAGGEANSIWGTELPEGGGSDRPLVAHCSTEPRAGSVWTSGSWNVNSEKPYLKGGRTLFTGQRV